MSETIVPNTVNVQVDRGFPYFCFTIGVGNFWELFHVGPRRWVVVHWVPADIDPQEGGDINCDDMQSFMDFERGLVAFSTVVRLVREGYTPKKLKELCKPAVKVDQPTQALPKAHVADQTLHLSAREIGTVLAALRLYQMHGGAGTLPPTLKDIASDSDQFTPLDSDQIDTLCEGINF